VILLPREELLKKKEKEKGGWNEHRIVYSCTNIYKIYVYVVLLSDFINIYFLSYALTLLICFTHTIYQKHRLTLLEGKN